jgi:hypothetical protein
MWIASVYGFYSIACASKPDGTVDSEMLMIRARRADHLRRLQQRFPSLSGYELITLRHSDYRYRLIVPKSVWISVLSGMAAEQEWSNFKNAVAERFSPEPQYPHALHEVWAVMRQLK